MSDDDGDGIYAVTVDLGAGLIEYKFTVDGWNAQEEFVGGESCTLTTGYIHQPCLRRHRRCDVGRGVLEQL